MCCNRHLLQLLLQEHFARFGQLHEIPETQNGPWPMMKLCLSKYRLYLTWEKGSSRALYNFTCLVNSDACHSWTKEGFCARMCYFKYDVIVTTMGFWRVMVGHHIVHLHMPVILCNAESDSHDIWHHHYYLFVNFMYYVTMQSFRKCPFTAFAIHNRMYYNWK